VAVMPQIHSSVAGQNQISPSGVVAPSQLEIQATGTHTCLWLGYDKCHSHTHTHTHTHTH
jgi:hypothetical protein